MTKIYRRIAEWNRFCRPLNRKTVGFVPTMGALHDGHASLIARSKKENEFTVVSIFVNPTQFGDPMDMEKYPRTDAKDLEL